jgi:hypothetical protein
MPITTIENTRQLEFGYGDIEVCPALLESDEVIGAVAFFQNENANPIGEHKDHEPNMKVDVTDSPIRMTFEKVESIDVVIWALEKTKRMMLAGTTKVE